MSGSDDLFDFDDDDADFMVEKDPPPATPSSSKKRKSVTPTNSKRKREDEEDEEEITFEFCTRDSEDEDEEDPLIPRKKWVMVESKANGTRYSRDPPTHPTHRYVNRKIDTREDRAIPRWWKIAKVLQTTKKMSDTPEDQGDNKLRDFYLELGREKVDDVDSQQSQASELTPLTPEVIVVKDRRITPEIRKRAEEEIKKAGPEGLLVTGTNYRVFYLEPNTNVGRYARPWGLFAADKGKMICAVDPNCVSRRGTRKEEKPKCSIHKGGQVGFVLGHFTDSNNTKNEVLFHVIASFTFNDEDDKEDNAAAAMNTQISENGGSWRVWGVYKKERESLDKPTPQLLEIKKRRRYYDSEEELMRNYAARQTTTLFRMLLWPDTSTRIICLNRMINFPNGAYKELVDEMNEYGLELRIHDKILPKICEEMQFSSELEIPYLLKAEPGESLGSLLKRGNELQSLPDKDKSGNGTNKDKPGEKKEKAAALYWVSSPYVIYAGQALKADVHSGANATDPVVDYKANKGDHPDPKVVPIGILAEAEDRYKYEFIIHTSAFIASVLGLKNCINPKEFSAQSHPLCINRQTNCTYLDKKSWGMIHACIMKTFFVDVYLGPKVDNL